MEERLALYRFDNVLTICKCIANFSLGGLENQAVRVGEYNLRAYASEVSHKLLECLSRHHLDVVVQRSVVHEGIGVLDRKSVV